jgi:hypothetical protein
VKPLELNHRGLVKKRRAGIIFPLVFGGGGGGWWEGRRVRKRRKGKGED